MIIIIVVELLLFFVYFLCTLTVQKSLPYILLFIFFSPIFPVDAAGIQLSVCVDCTSHHAATQTHTHTCRAGTPHPSQTVTGRTQHDIQTTPRAMHWDPSTFMLPSCTNTHMHSHSWSHAAWRVQGASTLTHIVQCFKFCPHEHWGTLLVHPFWRLEAAQKTKHLQRQGGGRLAEEGGWWKKGGHPTRTGSGREREKEKCLMCWCSSCWFDSSSTYLSQSVALNYPLLTLWFSNNWPITGWDCHCARVPSTLKRITRLFPLRICSSEELQLMRPWEGLGGLRSSPSCSDCSLIVCDCLGELRERSWKM